MTAALGKRAGSGQADGENPTPRLAAGCKPTELPLSPEEGYLLSRVDGRTPRSLLREIGGLPPERVDTCLEAWAKKGWIEFDGAQPSVETEAPKPAVKEAAVDPGLDIPVEFQQEILAFSARLEAPYHELLGVPANADAKAIKKAYFGLSKTYHPDRYFRRELGPFQAMVEAIFKRVLEAYELLSDPATREQVQQAEAAKSSAGAAGKPAATSAKVDARMAARRLRNLRRRSGASGANERKRKAKSFFESGMAAFRAGRWLEAAGSVRLAIAFDPKNQAFRESFVEVQTRAHEERAKVLIREAESHFEMRSYGDALRCYEEATHYRPFDGELFYKAARISWQLGRDLRKAKEWAVTACELEPNHAAYRRTLGQVYKAAGLAANAKRELQAAVRLDPKDAEAAAELKGL